VVIDERDPRTHRFRKIFLTEGAIVVNKVDSGPLRDIRELNGRSFGGSADACFCDQKNCESGDEKRGERTFHPSPVSLASDAECIGNAINVVEPGSDERDLQDAFVVEASGAELLVIVRTAFCGI